MEQAIFGLIGVVVGALITGGTSFWSEKRRESAELRAALRILDDEIESAIAGISACLELRHWHPRIREIVLEDWPRSRGIIAARLNSVDWMAVSNANAVVTAITIRADARLNATGAGAAPVLAEDDEETLAHAKATLEVIQGMMETIHSPEPGLYGLLKWAGQERKRAKRGIQTSPPELPKRDKEVQGS
jgi:hypothetical protein